MYLTVHVTRQVALLAGGVEDLGRRTPRLGRIYSIETDVILATVVGVRQGRVDTDRASRADKTILQLLSRLSLRLTFLLLLLPTALLLLPA